MFDLPLKLKKHSLIRKMAEIAKESQKNSIKKVKISNGTFTNVYVFSNQKSKVFKQYKDNNIIKKKKTIYAMYMNEKKVYDDINSPYVQTYIRSSEKWMWFEERRAIDDLHNFMVYKEECMSDIMIRHFQTHIMCGLNALHDEGIYCQDLKLENILVFAERGVNADGLTCKLADFNIIQGRGFIDLVQLDKKRLITECKMEVDIGRFSGARKSVLGTYHAPEEFKQSKLQVGMAADIFRFGIIMYHLHFYRRHIIAKKQKDVSKDIAILFGHDLKEITTYVRMQALHNDMFLMWGEEHAVFKYVDPDPETRVEFYDDQFQQIDPFWRGLAPIEDDRVRDMIESQKLIL